MRQLSIILGAACIVVALLIVLVVIDRTSGSSAREQLNGTWTSELVTFHFDVPGGTYERVALGTSERKSFVITRETWSSITIVSDGPPIIATFHLDGTMTLQQEGKLPLTFRRP